MADYTIKQVSEKSNPWENPKGGTIYYKNVLLEGHPKPVSIGKKSPDALKVGDTVSGQIIEDSGPSDKFKAEYVPNQGAVRSGGYTKSPADQDSIVRQSALKSAVAAMQLGSDPEEVTKVAEVFYAWLSKATDTETPGYEAAKATADRLRLDQDEEDGKEALVEELTDLTPEAKSLLGTEEISLEDIPF